MYRLDKRLAQRIVDFGVLSVALWAAFLLRFDGDIPVQYLKRALFLWPYVVLFQYLTLAFFRVPAFSWRFIGLREVSRILSALSVAAALLLVVRLIVGFGFNLGGPAQYVLVPIGVIVIDFVLAFVGIAGVRGLRRMLVERVELGPRRPKRELTPTLLIGAGRAGLMVAREIARRSDLGLRAVGFVDDDPQKVGTTVHGVPVLGTTAELADVVSSYPVEQAIITIANASGSDIRRIRERSEAAKLTTKIIPGLYELIDGRINLSRIRDVSIEDLLRRDVVDLDSGRLREFLTDRCVLVTGAGGSIGAEIVRQVARQRPSRLLLLERAEPALFAIHQEIGADFPDIETAPLLVDVCDAEAVEELFRSTSPDVVFHAAAHKHVPMLEWNPGEALKNNVLGTKVMADACHDGGADAFVLVSTDKAVNPTSIMGASKRVAELYVQSLATESETKFVAVRFGNVLGSTGSVVPIFKEQIARGGPVTVTHPDMKRYFMTIPEATSLVLQAAAIGQGGEVYVLDMGEPVRIVDLADDLIRLSGFEPDAEIAIEFTGIRPGEKLFEELGFDAESMLRTKHPKIFVLRRPLEPFEWIEAAIGSLDGHLNGARPETVRALLQSIVPELHEPRHETADVETSKPNDSGTLVEATASASAREG